VFCREAGSWLPYYLTSHILRKSREVVSRCLPPGVFMETPFLDITSFIASLAADLDSWMSSNRLSLHSSKTQMIWLGTRQQLLKLDFALLAAQFPQFTILISVRDLGYTGQHSFFLSSHL